MPSASCYFRLPRLLPAPCFRPLLVPGYIRQPGPFPVPGYWLPQPLSAISCTRQHSAMPGCTLFLATSCSRLPKLLPAPVSPCIRYSLRPCYIRLYPAAQATPGSGQPLHSAIPCVPATSGSTQLPKLFSASGHSRQPLHPSNPGAWLIRKSPAPGLSRRPIATYYSASSLSLFHSPSAAG